MVCELKVIVKNEEKTLRTKHLIYDAIEVKEDDPIIRRCIEESIKNFGEAPDGIKIQISMEIE